MKRFLKNINTQSCLLLFVSCLIIFAAPSNVQAQAEAITLSNEPRFPEPYEPVTVSITSRLSNLNDKETIWRKNGEIIESGIGIQEITTNVGAVGETTAINIRTRAGGEIVDRTIQITPVDVDLVWETEESYTPPFYKGKALHPGWGDVRITTIPYIYRGDGSRYTKQELVYTWQYNGLTYGGDSGRGENSFVTGTVPRRGTRVSLEIETPSGDLVARESITIPVSQPELVMYEYSPLLGPKMESVLVDDFRLASNQNEISMVAYPYFFLVNEATAQNLTYDWEMNGEEITSPTGEKNTMRLRREPGASGQTYISVDVSDESRIFPDASTNLNLEF